MSDVIAEILSESESLPNAVRKFYFIEYFLILLQAVSAHQDESAGTAANRHIRMFNTFDELKHRSNLGDSKYKKIHAKEQGDRSETEEGISYTFWQVLEEAMSYSLISTQASPLSLSEKGLELLAIYESKGVETFNLGVLRLMEKKYRAFRYLITFLYQTNPTNGGMVVLPMYSPTRLGFTASDVRNTGSLKHYCGLLLERLTKDIETYIKKRVSLEAANNSLLDNLRGHGLIGVRDEDCLNPKQYNLTMKRIRDFWQKYFLVELYHYTYSLSTFEIWAYRGKQLGLVHATEFFPNFSGKVIYPTSVITTHVNKADFTEVYDYGDQQYLYVHSPSGLKNENSFADTLLKSYLSIRRNTNSYFVNLMAVRELTCYSMKISEKVFGAFLDRLHRLNMTDDLGIKISLEVDRIPEETKAIYLKQEPVFIEGKPRNIIAIELGNGATAREQIPH